MKTFSKADDIAACTGTHSSSQKEFFCVLAIRVPLKAPRKLLSELTANLFRKALPEVVETVLSFYDKIELPFASAASTSKTNS